MPPNSSVLGATPDADGISTHVHHFGADYFSFWHQRIQFVVPNSPVLAQPGRAERERDEQLAERRVDVEEVVPGQG